MKLYRFEISAGSPTEIMFGPKRTNFPYFRCKSICMSCARLVKIHNTRGRFENAARKGSGDISKEDVRIERPDSENKKT